MGNCQLVVALDASVDPERMKPTVAQGVALTGTVTVVVDESVRCDGLTVGLVMQRHDRHGGSGPHGQGETTTLFTGTWEPGTHRYPFTLEAPDRPGYEGQVASWEWAVEANADIPWASDPRDRTPFVVASPPARSHDDIVYEPQPITQSGGASTKRLLQKYAIGFFTVPMLALVPAVLVHAGLEREPHPAILIGSALVGELLMFRIFRNAQRQEQDLLGPDLEVAIDRSRADYRAPGEVDPEPKVRGVARRRAATALIDHVWVELVVTEQTMKRSSDSEGRTTYSAIRHKLWETDRRFEPTGDDAYPFELPLPEPGTVPYSIPFDERRRGVEWLLRVRVVRSDRAEDEVVRCVIDVRPA